MNELKVGDWLVFEGKELFKASKEDLVSLVGCDLELWEPKEGEWCWFTMSDGSKPLFGQFSGMYKDKFTWDNRYYFSDACEPFIGELPSYIKDNE